MNRRLKIALLLMFCFYGHYATCQRTNPPLYFLDSIEIDISKVYIHPTSIDSIKVDRKTGNGEVYIFSDKDSLHFTTLQNIFKEHTQFEESTGSILFKINGEIINDTSDIKIDLNYHIYVTADSLEDVDYLKTDLKTLKILSIDLEREKKEKKIYIREGSCNAKPKPPWRRCG